MQILINLRDYFYTRGIDKGPMTRIRYGSIFFFLFSFYYFSLLGCTEIFLKRAVSEDFTIVPRSGDFLLDKFFLFPLFWVPYFFVIYLLLRRLEQYQERRIAPKKMKKWTLIVLAIMGLGFLCFIKLPQLVKMAIS